MNTRSKPKKAASLSGLSYRFSTLKAYPPPGIRAASLMVAGRERLRGIDASSKVKASSSGESLTRFSGPGLPVLAHDMERIARRIKASLVGGSKLSRPGPPAKPATARAAKALEALLTNTSKRRIAMPTEKVEQTLKEEEELVEVVEGDGSNGREAPEVDGKAPRPKKVPAIGQGKSTAKETQPLKAPGGSLEEFRAYALPVHPLRKTIEMLVLLYQIEHGELRGKKRPARVSRRRFEVTPDALEYANWFARTELPLDMQILILDLLAHRPLPEVLDLEFTSYTPAVCQLMFEPQARQAAELMITLGWSDIRIAQSINELKPGFQMDENDVANYRYLCWNLPNLRRVALAGYLGELGEEIRRTQVIQSPLKGPLSWSQFSRGLGVRPLETYEPVIRALSGCSPIQADLVNLEIDKLNRSEAKRYLQLGIHSGFNHMAFLLRRGKQDAAYKHLGPLKTMADLALKLDINILGGGFRY